MRVAPRAWMRRIAAPALAGLTLAATGCSHRPPPPPPPPPAPVAPRPVVGYDGMKDSLAAADLSGLAGRRIVLDAGHGGFFRGALGVHGLTEAEVNLAVAGRLRDRLVAHGAQVLLTHESDRDYLSPTDSSLRGDLAERVRIANAFAPDFFLSIHHNADATGSHDVNETQTYYKLGDDGPSLDAAQDLHRSLVRNVGIRPHKVVPGNYFVLRGSDAPAVLTETSYITDPDVEERLRLPEKQALEADALFLGLARYFARRLPVIAELRAHDDRAPGEDTLFVTGNPGLSARVQGDFDQAVLTVDGEPRPLLRLGDRLGWQPDRAWTAGDHEARLAVRLTGAGAARERRLRFAIRPRPARLSVASWPERNAAGGPFAVRVELLARNGVLAIDSSRVRIRSVPREAFAPAETTVVARDGVAWGYFRPRPLRKGARVQAASLTVALSGPPGRPPAYPTARPTVPVETLRLPAPARGAMRDWSDFVRAMPEGVPLAGAPGTDEPARITRWLDRNGFAVLGHDAGGSVEVPRLPGYRRWAEQSGGGIGFTAIAGGALHGRRITLDPEGGGEDPAGVGASGTRAAHLNLEVARILAQFLAAAGAEVRLTRSGDLALTEAQRVQESEAFRADRYLRIGHRLRRFGYYYSSVGGRRWAVGATNIFASLGIPAPPMVEDALYPLQQSSCPALYASPARVDSARDEESLLAPGALRAEAYALFLSLAREWAPAASWAVDSLEVRDEADAPVPGAFVTLGDALVLETDARGIARFARTEPGPIEARVDEPRVRARTVLLDSMRGAVLTGPRGD
jgi:N-acetylmuramoyl-L-alanine amidase